MAAETHTFRVLPDYQGMTGGSFALPNGALVRVEDLERKGNRITTRDPNVAEGLRGFFAVEEVEATKTGAKPETKGEG